MAKRHLVSLLPSINQTADLANFFGSTVDQVFQPGTSEAVSGYIGRRPSSVDPNDFYVGEPSAVRAAYQLESGMVSYDTTGVLTEALSYPDFIGYLQTNGANVTDHQRLFETDYYSFAPPINIDMLVNYHNYYWFGDLAGADDLPVIDLRVPLTIVTADGNTTTFALPNSINAVTTETPTVYVDNIQRDDFTQVGDTVVLSSAPVAGSSVIVTRVADLAVALRGQVNVDISDINTNGITTLTSGMRVRLIDIRYAIVSWDTDLWDTNPWDGGIGTYIVDGVGVSIRLTSDVALIRDLAYVPQYVTIDRSSTDGNLWSLHNLWVHKDAFAWAKPPPANRQALRPIIEFVRDIARWDSQIWSESIDPLFMLYDLNHVALNDPTHYPASNFAGSRIFGYAAGTTQIDSVLRRSLIFDQNGYIGFTNDTATQRYNSNNGAITGLYLYAIDTSYESLWHLTSITTSQGMTNGFYDVPVNLQSNPSSNEVTTIFSSMWTEQFTTIIAKQPNLIGVALGANNYRDTVRDITLGQSILQHRAPLLKAMLLASDTMFDLPQAIHYSEQEYNRFRSKFARKLTDLRNRGVLPDYDLTTAGALKLWMTTALKAITRDKSNKFPFALNSIGGDKYFIPPTPTCLGIMPAAVPAMIGGMILGHDGSLTPIFNDWRDPIMLTLEQAIFASLPFQTEKRPVFDVQHWIGQRFYQPYNGYTRDEMTAILAPLFEIWAQQNKLDYRSHTDYDLSDPFTWNFRGVLDQVGNPLPGNWRAIYRWYYGTDAPDQRPWEMLGFVGEPDWWQATYGPAPYTSHNIALWTDLENGTIRGGLRSGNDTTYARIDRIGFSLRDIIPVDGTGNLLDPVAIGIVTDNIDMATAARSWLPGDYGPVESQWINSPSYRFALALAGFLMKPARFVEQCWDMVNIGFVNQQWVDLTTLERPLNVDQFVHGETNDTGIVRVIGISQWIADYLMAIGQSSTAFGNAIRGLDVRLIHRMAGFTSNDEMKMVADNFGLVPSEDVDVVLYSSPITSVETYSGVILEWTGRAWRAIGYDMRNAFFTIIPPDVNGPKGLITIASAAEPVIVAWRSNSYYPSGILVENLQTVWQCLRSHTSSLIFEQTFWQSRPDLNTAMIRAPRVITYARGLPTTQTVLYGTDFSSYQDVADFLLGWQRWLESCGWIFDGIDSQTGEILNWSLAVKEFLSWAQVQWAPGNFIALSPSQQLLQFSSNTGMVLNVENLTNDFYGLLDRSGLPINQRDATINRLDGTTTIAAVNADIFFARLNIANTEHALILSNVTIFDDIIYLPLYSLRQTRLRMICKRSRDWTGRMDAPGFVIVGNDLRSSFEKAVEDVRLMFDIELSDRTDLQNYTRHTIGFQKRGYLENLLLSDIEQFEFFQGMIQQKGTPGVFDKLTRSQRASNDSNLQFLEEWAIRIDEFGPPLDPFLIFFLGQTDVRDDPQIVRFGPTNTAPLDWIVLSTTDDRWIDRPIDPGNFFTTNGYASSALPSAGPVRLSDALYTIFHIADVPTLYLPILQTGLTPFPVGSSTWVYERGDSTFTVLRSFEISTSPNAILKILTVVEDPTVLSTRIIFQQPIGLTTQDIGNYLVIDGLSFAVPELQGLATISAVNLLTNSVDIIPVSNAGFDFTTSLTNAPFVRVLREVRFANYNTLIATGYHFATGDLVWIDDDGNQNWAVMQWSGVWNTIRKQPLRISPRSISETVIYRVGTTVIDQQMIIDEPVVDDVVVIDPISGLIAGIADREIDFKTDYDPARYNAGVNFAANPWGARQIGHVWWNLATVKFLDPLTDTLGISDARDIDELTYRIANWAHIAPNSSVDIYEWIESNISPLNYTGPGVVFNHDSPSWVELNVFDPIIGSTILYYYWVTGLTITPNIRFRHTDITSIALAITNPSGLDLAWMAPIAPDTLIVSGVAQFLDDFATAMKIRLTLDPENPGRHDEWQLLRPTDQTSLPSTKIWQKLRDSLATFNILLRPVPDQTLSPMRATGIRASQGMFDVTHNGLFAARQSFIGIINKIFTRIAFRRERLTLIDTLYRNTPVNQYLLWIQNDPSYVFDPPPYNEWDFETFGLDERNYLLRRAEFHTALTSGKKIRVLLNGINNQPKQWSIWEFDPDAANAIIAVNPNTSINETLIANADSVFNVATAYEYSVIDRPARDRLSVAVGDRVLVTNDSGFWSIWKYLPNRLSTDNGFVLWRLQSYDTGDFIATVDWYAPGYSAANPPITVYDTISDRNAAEGQSPINRFVKINNDGTGWIWMFYDPTTKWITVAVENGTLALSDKFYNVSRIGDTRHASSEGCPTGWYDDTALSGVFIWRQLAAPVTVSSVPSLAAQTLTLLPINANDFANSGGSIWGGIWGGAWGLIQETPIKVGQFVIGPGLDRSTRVEAVSGPVVILDTPVIANIPVGTDIAFTALSADNIANRDGSWELYVLVDVLRYGGLLTDAEINEVFFSVLNFIHVQQDNVDWAFKTSFMTIIGYNVPMEQTPVLLSDQTASLKSYIEEVKPYHVKLREFATQYNTDIDIGHTTLTEDNAFDITVLFDRYTATADINTSAELGVIYLHTTVTKTLTRDGPTIDVDNIRSFPPVSVTHPLIIQIGANVYQIAHITPDVINVSSIVSGDFQIGLSGQLTTVSDYITVADGTRGNQVEVMLAMPNASRRITQYYRAPNDLATLLSFGMHPNFVTYTIISDAAVGDVILNLDRTVSIAIGQPIIAPNIIRGTLITAVTPTTITIDHPVINPILSGVTVAIATPIQISDTFLSQPDYQYNGQSPASDVSINPALVSQPGGFDLRSPYRVADHPEERLLFEADDALHLTVTALPFAGGPPQSIKAFDVSTLTTTTTTLFFTMIAQSYDGVMVFRDGVRATLTTDYTVDYFARTVTVNLLIGARRVQQIAIHSFGFGGNSAITSKFFLNYTTNPFQIDQPITPNNAYIVVNGTALGSGFTANNTMITLDSPPVPGTDVAVINYTGGGSTATQLSVRTLPYDVGQTWTLSPHDDQTIPQHAGTIVEVNGLRLTPPRTFYGRFTPAMPWMYLPDLPSAFTVYINGVEYTQTIPVATRSDPSSPYPFNLVLDPADIPPTNIAGQFVLMSNVLVSFDRLFTANVAVSDDSTPSDYTVINNALHITTTLLSTDHIIVSTFSNASCIGIETVVYAVGQTPYFVPIPYDKSYALVTMKGLTIVPDNDYTITDYTIGWDDVPWDSVPYDFEWNGAILDIFAPTSGSIVAMICTGEIAHDQLQWMVNSRLPATVRMPPVYDNFGQQLIGQSTHGNTTSELYQLLDEYLLLSPYMAGSLATDLQSNDTSMSVNLFLQTIVSDLAPQNPLMIPTTEPGVIWIGAERIEYFGYTRTNNVATLSQLRRATQGTSISEQRQVITSIGDGTAHSYVLTGIGTPEVLVNDNFHAYTTTITNGNTTVVIAADNHAFITIAMTTGYTYHSGTSVYNGSLPFVASDFLRQLSVLVGHPLGVNGVGLAGDLKKSRLHAINGVFATVHIGFLNGTPMFGVGGVGRCGTLQLQNPTKLVGVMTSGAVGTMYVQPYGRGYGMNPYATGLRGRAPLPRLPLTITGVDGIGKIGTFGGMLVLRGWSGTYGGMMFAGPLWVLSTQGQCSGVGGTGGIGRFTTLSA